VGGWGVLTTFGEVLGVILLYTYLKNNNVMKQPLILLAYTWLIFGALYLTTPSPRSAPTVTEIEDPIKLPLSLQYEEEVLVKLKVE
jgi:4-hydroxybenzoate polyprenyltransferase